MSTTKVLISGCNGKMGQIVRELVEADPTLTFVGGYDCNGTSESVISSKDELFTRFGHENVDVIIDFSRPSALPAILGFANYKAIPVVIGTTGLEESHWQIMEKAAASIPIFYASNMSFTMALVKKVVKLLAAELPNFSPEILEKHHEEKADSPSGTAIMLADAINDTLGGTREIVYARTKKREKNEIGIASIRGGNVTGYHEVGFYSSNEEVTVTHSVYSKTVFASGAIKAAKFIISKDAGLYGMDDLV